TSSRDAYGAAAAFYLAAGYEEAARLRDFYSEGDDLITFTRRFTPERAPDDQVEAYRLAFEYRDFAAERDFLVACSARFGLGDPGRVVEWACGPAQHLEHFGRDRARSLVGVDPSEQMLQAARRRLDARAELILADIDERVVRPGADLGFVPLSSVHLLARAERIAAFLETARRSLVPGGVLVIEATHPRDLTPEGTWATDWRIHERGVEIEARTRFDLARRVGPTVPVTLSIRSRRDGVVRDHVREMTWYVPDLAEWEALARTAGLEVAATLGDLDVGTPFTHPSAWRLVLVLRVPR
ncbi:MAG: class I SAM-dependent methyltransferase, partial [Myxococcales bacterium]|nr:class I SAM-dependent methyltransferase [Myxococcales bacterium]